MTTLSTGAEHQICPLPAPTGPHHVGRHLSECVDPEREDIYASQPGTPRELSLCTWYPAQAEIAVGTERAPYLPDAWAPIASALGARVDEMSSHAVADIPLSDEQDRYPVILLSPSGFTALLMASLAEELASHGYVVVGINHTYEGPITAFTDGRVVGANPAATAGALGAPSGSYRDAFAARAAVCRYKAADLRSVVNHLETLDNDALHLDRDHLDLDAISAVGHSFGGNAALEWGRDDPRCRAAVNLDGAIWTEVATLGLPRPALQILADHPELSLRSDQAVAAGVAPDAAWYEAEQRIIFTGWRELHRLAHPGATACIAGATHASFMDVGFLALNSDSPLSALPAPAIDPTRCWRITSDLILALVSRHLLGATEPSLDEVIGLLPEVSSGPPSAP